MRNPQSANEVGDCLSLPEDCLSKVRISQRVFSALITRCAAKEPPPKMPKRLTPCERASCVIAASRFLHWHARCSPHQKTKRCFRLFGSLAEESYPTEMMLREHSSEKKAGRSVETPETNLFLRKIAACEQCPRKLFRSPAGEAN